MSDEDETTHPFEEAAGDTDDSDDTDPIGSATVESDDETDPIDDTDMTDDGETGGIQTKSDSDDDRERELEKWEDRLDQREEGLDLRAEKLKDRAEELDQREADIETERANLEDWRADLDDWEAQLEQREQDLDDREAAIRERETELAERAADLDEKEQTLHTYVSDNLGDVDAKITDAVRESIGRAMQDIEPGKAEVDQESVDQTVSSAIDSAMADHKKGRFGAPGTVVFGLIGLALVAGGVSTIFLAEATNLTPLFADELANYGVAAALVLVGLAINLAAAAGRL